MKKFIIYVMTGVLLLSIGGCTRNNDSVTNSSQTPSLTWYVPGEKQTDTQLVMDEINKMLEPEIGAKLDLQFIDGGAFTERMNMNMASGTEFDICFSGYINRYNHAVAQGGFVPLNALIEKEAPLLKKELPEYAWKAVEIEGEIYAVPNLQIYAMPRAIFIQKSFIDKYNYDVSKINHINDLEPLLKMIKENDTDVYPYNPDFGIGPWLAGEFEEVVSGLYTVFMRRNDPDCKVFKIYETPEYIQGVHTLRDWYEKGYIRKDIASITNNSAEHRAGKYATWVASYKPGIEQDLLLSMKREIVVIPIEKPHITTDLCTQTLTAISVTSKQPQKAIKLIEKVNTNEKLYRLIVHGIEDMHYTKSGENHITYTDALGYKSGGGWKYGNQFNAFLLEGMADDTWKKTIELNESASNSKLLGFVLNTDTVINEISQCTGIVTEYRALENGSLDPVTTLNAYSNKLREAGIDKIIAETQEQVDAFLLNKKNNN